MTATYAQKQAVARYAAKKRASGMKSRTLFATDAQWSVLLPLSRYIKTIDFNCLESVDIDDDTGAVTFNVKEGKKFGTVGENQIKDDTTYQTEQDSSVEA